MSVTTNSTISGVIASNPDWKIYANDGRFGGFWNGTDNDSPALQAAVNDAATYTPPKSVQLPPKVCLRDTVFVPAQVFLVGCDFAWGAEKTTITPHASASYTNNFMLQFNTLDGGVTPVVQIYSRPYMCGVQNVFFNNGGGIDMPNCKIGVGCGGTYLQSIYANKVLQLWSKPNNYIDNVHIDTIHIAQYANDYAGEYMIDLNGNGDALRLGNLNFPVQPVTDPTLRNAIQIKNSRCGGSIQNLVNGTIRLERCEGFRVSDFHNERGQLLLNQSNVSLRDSWFSLLDSYTGSPYYPVELEGRSTGGGSFELLMENVQFVQGNSVFNRAFPAEVKMDTEYTLRCLGVRRISQFAGTEATNSGIRLHTAAGSEITEWTKNSFYLSQNGAYSQNRAMGTFNSSIANPFSGVSGPSAITGLVAGTLATGTYYYRSQSFIDVDALLGRNSASGEISQAVVLGQCVSMSVTANNNTSSVMLRVYRGTSTGSYNFYVDIPIINASTLVDTGSALSGWPWISRSAGAIDTLNAASGEYYVTPASGAQGLIPFETIIGDADSAIGGGGYINSIYVWNSPLTAARTATLSSLATRVGTRVRVVRTAAATGAFNLNINNPAASLLKALSSAGTWAEVEYCSDSTWRVTASGSL